MAPTANRGRTCVGQQRERGPRQRVPATSSGRARWSASSPPRRNSSTSSRTAIACSKVIGPPASASSRSRRSVSLAVMDAATRTGRMSPGGASRSCAINSAISCSTRPWCARAASRSSSSSWMIFCGARPPRSGGGMVRRKSRNASTVVGAGGRRSVSASSARRRRSRRRAGCLLAVEVGKDRARRDVCGLGDVRVVRRCRSRARRTAAAPPSRSCRA